MPNPTRLAALADLRNDAGLSLSEMARRCGLRGRQSHQTAGAWERGVYTPKDNRRAAFIGYLWDDLGLRRDPVRFEEIWSMLGEEWGWEEVSDEEWAKHFPGVARPVGAAAGEVADEENASTLPPPFQAPGLVSHFVGRASEIQRLVDLLAPEDATSTQSTPHSAFPTPHSVIALAGMGGVGKTTLATSVAHALRERFADGVLWGVAATANPLDILGSWARAYGYDFSGLSDVESRAAALRNVLDGKQTLLVLDDVTSVERVRPLLPGSAGCAVLLTTRNEEVAIGLGAQVVSLSELSPVDGVALLTRILGAERIEREGDAAQEIGDALHHLPLAVEIAAQFLAARPRRTLVQMAERLRHVHHRLNLQISDRAVRASFAVSWEGLDDAHRQLFAQLAVFAGRSFTAEAIAYVADLDLWTAQDRLETLKALSLVREEGVDRYQQHPLLADFAREQLGEDAESQMRLADYYLAFAQQHQTDYVVLEPEWDGVMAGMESAYQLEAWERVVEYAEVLEEPWFTRAEYSRARQGYKWATEAAEVLKQVSATARFLIQWGRACVEQNDYSEASKLLSQGLNRALISEDATLIADAYFYEARLMLEQTNYPVAKDRLARCRQLRNEEGDPLGLAATMYWEAELACRTGNLEHAETLCQKALDIQREKCSKPGMIETLRLLSYIATMNEDYKQAEAYSHSALKFAEEIQDRGERGAVLYSLAVIGRRQGNYDEALEMASYSLRLFEQMGSQLFTAMALYEISRVQEGLAQYQAALKTGLQSLRLMYRLEDKFNLVGVLCLVGDLQQRVGCPNGAHAAWAEALPLAQESEHPYKDELQSRMKRNG